MTRTRWSVIMIVGLMVIGIIALNIPYAQADFYSALNNGCEGTGTGTATDSWHGGGHGGCHGGCTGTETASGTWHGGHHGSGSDNRGHGSHWAYAGTVTASLAEVLAEWSGISADDILNISQAYNLNAAQAINTVVLAVVANISLDEAAQIVASGELSVYLEENGLISAFMQARKEFGMTYMHQWMHGHGGGNGQAHAGSGTLHGHGMAAIGEDTIVSTLAQWSGFAADDISAIEDQYGFVDARLINTVVLAVVANISLDEAAQIVAQGNLATYLYDNGLVDAFRTARLEVMSLLGLGGGAGTGTGTGTTATTATP